MKFQVEFCEITKGFQYYCVETAIMLTDKVCSGGITRKEAIERLR